MQFILNFQVRLRLWVNPIQTHSGFNEVKHFSKTLKNAGFKIWLTLHYSDTWADPEHQSIPLGWQGLNFKGSSKILLMLRYACLQKPHLQQ